MICRLKATWSLASQPTGRLLNSYKITDQSALVGAGLRAAREFILGLCGLRGNLQLSPDGDSGAARRSASGGSRLASSVSTDDYGSRSDLVARNFSSGRCPFYSECRTGIAYSHLLSAFIRYSTISSSSEPGSFRHWLA